MTNCTNEASKHIGSGIGRAFLPGLMLGVVVGGFAGAVLPEFVPRSAGGAVVNSTAYSPVEAVKYDFHTSVKVGTNCPDSHDETAVAHADEGLDVGLEAPPLPPLSPGDGDDR